MTAQSVVTVPRMRHWDLVPGEIVILTRDRGGLRVEAGTFMFRDTTHAVFKSGGKLYEFDLADDGALYRGFDRFIIDAPARHRRTVLK